MGDIAREKGYSYILSMDDDVLLPASTMAFLANVGTSSRKQGCGAVAPLFQTLAASVDFVVMYCVHSQ